MGSRVLIVGTGSWGTALAAMLSRYGSATLLCRSREEQRQLIEQGENTRFLPGVRLPTSLHIAHDPAEALRAAEVVVFVVPSSRMRENVRALAPFLSPGQKLLSAAKGFEPGTRLRMTEVIEQELSPHCTWSVGALSGPNLAREIAEGRPATSVVASRDDDLLASSLSALSTPQFRVYANHDVVGVEFAGALKNIVAIGAGAIDGLQAGNNAKAAFVTRGLAEIARLGVAAGAAPLTFAGLAGLGDLLATTNSSASRNHFVGERFAQGETLDDIRAALLPQVAEGIETTRIAYDLAREYQVDMPIVDQTYKVLFEGKTVAAALADLMLREPKYELGGTLAS